MSTLDAVLSRIDQDIGHSVDRLFALLRIASISTDPAYKAQCRAAAEHVAADLTSIGFATSVRPTAGHPVVVGKANGAAGPHVLFYGHYDVQPVDPLPQWKTPPFEPRIDTLPDGRKITDITAALIKTGAEVHSTALVGSHPTRYTVPAKTPK